MIRKILYITAIGLLSCEHYPSNVEIVYKNTNGSGYKPSSKTSTSIESPEKETRKTGITSMRSAEMKPNTSADNTKDPYHVVQQGETFYSIARTYNIPPKDLISWNDYKEGQVLLPSTIIKLTPQSSSAEPLKIKHSSPQELKVVKNIEKPSIKGNCEGSFVMPVKTREIIVNFKDTYSGGVKSDGIIFKIKNDEKVLASSNGDGFSDYGNIVILKHLGNYFSIYGHLEGVIVQKGQFLIKGDKLASASAKEGKFYFAIRKGKVPINPSLCVS